MVREATSGDCEAIAQVMAVVAEEGSIGTEPPVDVAARARRFRETLDDPGGGGIWVLDDASRVLGWITAYQPATGVFSFGMALLPEARGSGGGRALLDTVLHHARSGGAHKVVLEVWPDNARAIALYARAGFHVEGLRRAHYRRSDGSLRSALLMAYLFHEHQ